MPFVRISLPEHFDTEVKNAISIAVHQSLVKAFRVPDDNYFHVIEELKPYQMKFPASYLGVAHSPEIVFIQITAAAGRSAEQKRELYQEIAEQITSNTPITKNNIITILVENDGWQNWSFGNGEIQTPRHLIK